MSFETIIEPGIGQWRSATIDEDGLPLSLNFHDDVALSPTDAVFYARVTRVDSTLDMAFLDMGDGRMGAVNLRRAKLLVKGRADSISDCLTEGQMLAVQVVAEPPVGENKAFVVTPRPRLMGRYVVVEAGAARLNFSKDIAPKAKKALEAALQPLTAGGAIIVRSRAGEVAPEFVAGEAKRFLDAINTTPEAPGLMFAFAPAEQALVAVPEGVGPVMVEGGGNFANARSLAKTNWPDLEERLKLYDGEGAAFEFYGVEEAIEEALADKIELPSGGWISITETRALTVVDVNMGSALQGRSAGDAKLVVNMEAAMAVGYHLRFQEIGGLVVVDFIDMSAKGAARDLMSALDAAFEGDPVPVQHTGISQFGLVEINRRRHGLSLRDRMTVARAPAPRADSVALDLIRRARRLGRTAERGNLVITASDAVNAWFDANPAYVEDLKLQTQRSITFERGAADVTLK
jgi:ribonuclease G